MFEPQSAADSDEESERPLIGSTSTGICTKQDMTSVKKQIFNQVTFFKRHFPGVFSTTKPGILNKNMILSLPSGLVPKQNQNLSTVLSQHTIENGKIWKQKSTVPTFTLPTGLDCINGPNLNSLNVVTLT